MAALADLLRQFRTTAGLTQEQLAERSDLSVGAIATLETGRRRYPRPTTLQALADALGLSTPERDALREAAARPSGAAVPESLPADVDDFVGREDTLRQLTDVLSGAGRQLGTVVAAVSGMGGVGKTALAVRAAHRSVASFPDGLLYLNLRAHGGGEPVTSLDALARLLRRLGTPADRIPTDVSTASARFRSLVADRKLLVVLDDVRSAEQVEPLLPGVGESVVLVTSRTRLLTLAGARQFHLDLLNETEALELLERSRGRDDSDAEAVRELVQLCGGLPLALRIVGSRLAAGRQSVEAMTAALGDERAKLDVLDDADTGVRATIGLSVAALRQGDQPVDRQTADALPLISLIDGEDFSLRLAAAALEVPADDAETALEHLVDANLLETPALQRYRLHDLVRAVGRDLAGAGDSARVRDNIVECFVALVWRLDDLAPTRRSLGQDWNDPSWSLPAADLDVPGTADAIDFDRDSMLPAARAAALGSADERRLVVRLSIGAAVYAMHRKRWAEWRDLLLLGLDLVDEHDEPVLTAQLRFDLGLVYDELGDFATGAAHLEQALELGRRLEARTFQIRVLTNLAHAYEQAGERLDRAYTVAEQALRMTREDGDVVAESWAHLVLGMIAGRAGDVDAQRAAFRPAVDLLMQRPNLMPSHAAMRYYVVGTSYQQSGQLADAAVALERGLDLYLEAGRTNGACEAQQHLGEIAVELGRYDEALTRFADALQMAVANELWDGEAAIRVGLARAYRALARGSEARTELLAARKLYTAHGVAVPEEVTEHLAE
ncbi:NB-ARC domain-containing protein [Kribbella sp. NPDC051770]|uniref:NB-ARC domain-containing protein n=1 Tax=Kribbella sp. NPDC051770 TaxID=3155413 RepID=UPI00341A26C9